MITYTATEIRINLAVPFTYENPLYSNAIQESYQLYANAGIDVTVSTSDDGFVQTITHSCTDDKADVLTEIHKQVVETIENLYLATDPDLPFARSVGVDTTQTFSFNDDHKNLETVFASHYKHRRV